MEELRLLVVADDPLARAGLAALLADAPGCLVVAQINSAEVTADFLFADSYQADVIIWDVGWETADSLPDWEGVYLPVVALLADEADAGDVWAAGGRVLLPRDVHVAKLAAAAQAAVQGLVVIDPLFANALLTMTSETETAVPVEELTPRELEVLQLLAEGLTNKAIAQRLGISDHTVKFHVNAIMSKLGAQSRTEAVVRATRQGLLSL